MARIKEQRKEEYHKIRCNLPRYETELPGLKIKIPTQPRNFAWEIADNGSVKSVFKAWEQRLSSFKDSCDEAFKQREAAVKEVGVLKGELQQVREDRECQLLLVQQLNSQLARFEENIGCTVAETCSSQREQISLLQYESAAANQKLKASMLEIYNKNIYASSRSVGRTDMNEESSRSHIVFILRIHGVNENDSDIDEDFFLI
nr:kinesin-like protein KIN-14C [Tanacetum cinerariifolium]